MRRLLTLAARLMAPRRRFAAAHGARGWLALTACTAVLWLALPALALADLRLDVRTDRQSLSLDDTLTVQVTVQSQGTDSPRVDLPEFEGFEVLSRSVQQPMQFSFSFGNRASIQSSTIYTLVLQPTRVGALLIKPVRAELDGQVKTSRAMTVTVSGGSAAPVPGTNDPNAQSSPNGQAPAANNGTVDNAQVDPVAFLRTVADKAEPYEGDQVTVTIYLYMRERLQSAPNIVTEPTMDGLWVQDLLPPNHALQPARQIVNGAAYAVYVLRRFAAFPLRSGDSTIGPMAVEISSASLIDIFAPSRARPNLNRSSAAVTLHVKPLPAKGRPPGEVADGRFSLSAKLDRNQALTGDAVTLTAIVRGQGNIRTVALALPKLPDIDALQPEIKDLVESPNDLVAGTREYRWLLVPRKPGHLVLPALTFAAFDPHTEQYAQVASDPLVLDVVGQPLAAATNNGQTTTGNKAPETTPQPKPDAHDAHRWAPIHTQSRLERGYVRWVERPWFGWLLALPGLCWLAVVSVAFARRRLTARTQSGAGRVLREAELRLRAAQVAANSGEGARFYAEASAALLSLLEARVGESMLGITRVQQRERLQALGVPVALATDLTRALEGYEFARFSAAQADASALGAQAAELSELWQRLLALAPRASQEAA